MDIVLIPALTVFSIGMTIAAFAFLRSGLGLASELKATESVLDDTDRKLSIADHKVAELLARCEIAEALERRRRLRGKPQPRDDRGQFIAA